MDAAEFDTLIGSLRQSPALAAKADIGVVAERLGLARAAISVGDDCLLCVRPHDLTIEPAGSGANVLSGTVESVIWLTKVLVAATPISMPARV